MYPAGTWSTQFGLKFQLSYKWVSTANHSRITFLVQNSSYKVPLWKRWIHKSNLSALCCTRRSHTILARNHSSVCRICMQFWNKLQHPTTSMKVGMKLMRAQSYKCSAGLSSLLSATHGSSRIATAFLVLCSFPPAS